MAFGWVGLILDVDLTVRKCSFRESGPYTRQYLGGRALAARIAWDEIPAGIDAYEPENRIIIATGPLTGTLAPTAGRTIMTSLSPRTYPKAWYTHSTLGGWFGPELKYAGFDAIVIHGRADAPALLEICGKNVRLVDAADLWGLDTRQAQLRLKERLGDRVQVLAIGPAGEKLVRFATVQHAEENAAGHSGFGAVWGSKNLKAIAVSGPGGVAVARPQPLIGEVSRYGVFKTVPVGGAIPGSSSNKRRPICSQACTFNCMVSTYEQTVDGRRLEFGFGFPAHREGRFWDEEPLPFWVISAMMVAGESRDPAIGTHQSSLILADLVLEERDLVRRQFRILSQKTWGYPDALEPTFENKAPVAIWSQNQHMLIDSLPLCDFAFPQVVRPFKNRQDWLGSEDISGDLDLDRRFLAEVTGVEFSREELNRIAERAFTLERLMLARAGRSRKMEEGLAPHFKLPCRADGTLIDEAGFSRLLDEYYSARGWDLMLGWPTIDLLKTLGLEQAAVEIDELRLETR